MSESLALQASARALAEIQAQAIGDRLRSGLDLLKLISGVELAEIGNLLAALKDFNAQTDIAGKVKAAIAVARIVVKFTPTDSDDKLIAALDSLITPDMLAIVTRIVQGFMGGVTAMDAAASAADQQKATALGINWGTLTQLALVLSQIIEILSKRAAS